jgi:hypothetical protein
MSKEFVTAVREVVEGEEAGLIDFTVDGRKMIAHRPGDGQLAVLMAMTSRHSKDVEQIAGIINFFVDVLDDHDHHYIVDRLMDRKDPFGVEEVTAILEYMVEEWTARPTK